MTDPTASQRGRRNRANGATYERHVARYLATAWPDAVRAVRNTNPDPGDIDGTSPSLWWSVKATATERYPAWMAEMAQKAADRVGVLVVKRKGCADPARWWATVTLHDLTALLGCAPPAAFSADAGALVRMELGALVPLLLHYTRAEVAA